jgi:hypothetical protein
MRVLFALTLASALAHADGNQCKLKGKSFVPRYATLTNGGPNDDSDITVFEVMPANAAEKKQACEDGGLADFSLNASGRVIRLVGRPLTELPNGVLTASFTQDGETRYEPAKQKTAKVLAGAAKGAVKLVLDAAFPSGACHLEVPVVVCGAH